MHMSGVIDALRRRVRFRTRLQGFGTRIREVGDPLKHRDKLTKLCNKYWTDKGDRAFGCHGYAAIYHNLFKDLCDKEISVCEIGLLHPSDRDRSHAPSLRVWRDYFPRAKLFGFDVDDFST